VKAYPGVDRVELAMRAGRLANHLWSAIERLCEFLYELHAWAAGDVELYPWQWQRYHVELMVSGLADPADPLEWLGRENQQRQLEMFQEAAS